MRNDVVSQYYIIEPEVAGGLGLNSNIDRTTFPPIVEKLHFVFEGWLGDPILESFPCFIVTDRLARKMEEAGLTGFHLQPLEVSFSESFHSSETDPKSEEFRWLVLDTGDISTDLATTNDGRLVASKKALELMIASGMKNAEISTAHEGPDE